MRVEHQYDGDTPASIAILEAIATIEDVDPTDSPTDLGTTLYDQIDPQHLTNSSPGTTVTALLL
ncbi:HalOD1 output domain-containing protein [Natronosalvus halobius]|uniref:HalOD1 output domain-containing protein n=1 Tax=Natronosalvus halobius TaxID=2953746 RepID=UPI00209F24A0|nr:HalOD1 output domain-containing protein [Natronosalvus halobius]USZ73565.1 hypothetical protein NGM15_18060 [Natronosalvus halobius]